MSYPNVNIPDSFSNRGPIPGPSPIMTFVAEEAAVAGALVTLSTTERYVKRCDVGDQPIGWAQDAMVANEETDITLFTKCLKSDVDAGSNAISYGDILSVANDGKVKKASAVTAEVIAGIAFSSAAASGQVIYEPLFSIPDPITT